MRVERVLTTPEHRGGGRGPAVCVPPKHVVAHLRRAEPGRYRISCLDDRRHFVRHGACVVEVGAPGATPRRVPPRSSRDYERRTCVRPRPSQKARAEVGATTAPVTPKAACELARLRRKIVRRDRRIRPLKQLRAELGREHRARLRSLGHHLAQAVAERDQSTREADALRVQLDAARRELASLRATRGASSREGGETKRAPVAQRAATSSASSAPPEARGQRVDLSGILEVEFERAHVTSQMLRADLACTRLERAAATRRAEHAERRALVTEVLLMCVMSTPPPPRIPVLVQIPYSPPARPFPPVPVILAPASAPASSPISPPPEVSSHEETAPAHADLGDDALAEPVARPSAILEHHDESPSSGIKPSTPPRVFRRVAVLLSMGSVGLAVARCRLDGDTPIGWRWLLLLGCVCALVLFVAREWRIPRRSGEPMQE